MDRRELLKGGILGLLGLPLLKSSLSKELPEIPAAAPELTDDELEFIESRPFDPAEIEEIYQLPGHEIPEDLDIIESMSVAIGPPMIEDLHPGMVRYSPDPCGILYAEIQGISHAGTRIHFETSDPKMIQALRDMIVSQDPLPGISR